MAHACWRCIDDGEPCPPPADNSIPRCQGAGHFNPYTGNDSRIITDLEVFGSKGARPLKLVRYANSRMAPMNTGAGVFGRDSVWTHSYQWLLRSAGSSNGRPAMSIGIPNGADILMVQSATDTTKYLPPASVMGTLVKNGTTWTFSERWGINYVFNQRTDVNGAVFYRFESFTDKQGNAYTVSYNNATDTLLRQVTDPSGRWLKFTYTDLGALAQTSTKLGNFITTQGVWTSITVGDTNSYRFLALSETNDYHNYPSAPIAEIEFYNKQGVKITGTPFASNPTFVDDPNNPAAHAAAMAFDGNTSTYYRYAFKRNGYIGIDAGVPVKIRNIRYFIPTGVTATVAPGQFVGMNDNPIQAPALKEVLASDGRKVTYDYSVFNDPSGLFSWQTLTGATYPDGANAIYSYAQQSDYCRPVLVDAYDPRIQDSGTHMIYQYGAGGIIGFLRSEFSGVTGELIASTGSTEVHIPQTTYANGRQVTDSYLNDQGQLLSRTDGNGNKTTFTYDQNGLGFLASMKDPLGRTTSYTHTTSGARLSQTTPDTTVLSYTRDAQDRVLTMTVTASGLAPRTTSYTRDANGRIIRQDNPDGSFEAWTYNTNSDPLTHTMVNGTSENWNYNVNGLKDSFTDASGATTTYAYNALDLVASITDALGHSTTYTYDTIGRLTKVTNADGTFATTTYDDFGNVIEHTDESGHFWGTQYDEFKRKITQTDPLGRNTLYSYGGGAGGSGCGACNAGHPVLVTEPGGRKTFNTYDLEWRMLSTTVAYGTGEAATTNYTYDKNDNVLTVKDPINRTVTLAYDTMNRRIKTTFPDAKFASMTYDGFGNVVSQTNELGQVTTMAYGVMNETLSITDPTSRTSSLLYEIAGAAATGRPTTRAMPSGKKVTTTFDALWRPVSVTVAPGTADAATTQTAYDAVSNVTSMTDAMNRVTSYTYDIRNRRVVTTDAIGRQWNYVYSPESLLLQTTNPDSTIESAAYDAAHRTLSTSDSGGRVTSYAYDALDHRLTLTDAKGQVTNWTYDVTGRMVTKRYADNTQETYAYDQAGQMVSQTKPAGQVATYTYDNRGRRTQIAWSGGSAPTVTLGYDAASRLLTANNGKGNITRAYDAAGRMTSEAQNIVQAAATYTVGYSYDADGQVANLTYPDGNVVSHTYNGRNQLASVLNGSPPPVTTYTRRTDGSIASMQEENGVISVNSFDALGRLTGVSHASGPIALGGEGYTLDAMSRRTGRTFADGSADGFAYDNAGQVTNAVYNNISTQEGYVYDDAGNRTQVNRSGGLTPASLTYTANNLNQYTAIQDPASGMQNPTYTANGDMLSDGKHTITWNAKSELTQVVTTTIVSGQPATATETYAYDAFGRRVSRSDGAAITYYVMDGWNVIAEYTAAQSSPTTKSETRRLTWGDDLSGSRQGAGGVGGLLMAEEISAGTATPYLYHYDGNGNVTLITDGAGAVAATYKYDAFGRTASMSGSYAATNKYRFSTKPIEAGSGFYFYGYRYYDPVMGRWPSRDPIGERGGLNLYVMVWNDAVDRVDLLGLDTPNKPKKVGDHPVLPGAKVPPSNQPPPPGAGEPIKLPKQYPGHDPTTAESSNAAEAVGNALPIIGEMAGDATYRSAYMKGFNACANEKKKGCKGCCQYSIYPVNPEQWGDMMQLWRYAGHWTYKVSCSEAQKQAQMARMGTRSWWIDL